jgi:hypothetical protein
VSIDHLSSLLVDLAAQLSPTNAFRLSIDDVDIYHTDTDRGSLTRVPMHLLYLSTLLCLVSTLQWQLQPASSFATVAPRTKLGQSQTVPTAAFFRHTNNGLLVGRERERNARLSTRQQVLPGVPLTDSLDSLLATTTATIAGAASTFEPSAAAAGLSPTTTVVVFIVGVIPYIWATIEFWRRIAVGASFGTGSDSVVFSIGEDDNPESSRGKQVLGKGALVIAYILFAIAAAVLGLVLLSVITTGPLPAFESAQ